MAFKLKTNEKIMTPKKKGSDKEKSSTSTLYIKKYNENFEWY